MGIENRNYSNDLTDRDFLFIVFGNNRGNITDFLHERIKGIKIIANSKNNILIGDREIKWTLFWKTLSQFLGFSSTYDDSRFSYIKSTLIMIQKGEYINVNNIKKNSEIHINDFENDLKEKYSKDFLIPYLYQILTDKKNKNLSISSGNIEQNVLIGNGYIKFDKFWKSFGATIFNDLRGRSDSYKKTGIIIELLNKIKNSEIKNNNELNNFINNSKGNLKLAPILRDELKKGEGYFLSYIREILKQNTIRDQNEINIGNGIFKINTFLDNLGKIFLINGRTNVRKLLIKLLMNENISDFNELLEGFDIKPRYNKEILNEFNDFLNKSKKEGSLIQNIRIMYSGYDYKKGWKFLNDNYIPRQSFLRRFGLFLGFCEVNSINECNSIEKISLVRSLIYGIINLEINSEEELFDLKDKMLYEIQRENV